MILWAIASVLFVLSVMGVMVELYEQRVVGRLEASLETRPDWLERLGDQYVAGEIDYVTFLMRVDGVPERTAPLSRKVEWNHTQVFDDPLWADREQLGLALQSGVNNGRPWKVGDRVGRYSVVAVRNGEPSFAHSTQLH